MSLLDDWAEVGDEPDDDDVQVDDYDIAASPNDFNTLTIFNFIDSGAVQIPGFQRNYVWDIKRASKLIESLIVGLPVPQVFLYEQDRNSFIVIDGQQRLLTIFFFMKGRFPRKAKRAELRQILATSREIPEEILHDDVYFENFTLRLPQVAPDRPNRFSRLKYTTLGDYKTAFDLRTIRNIIVKQLRPSDGDSSVYEMFSRLNSGGVNLRPQEIRSSLYYSPFMAMLAEFNLTEHWRSVLGGREPDLNLRDVEILLRSTAMWRSDESEFRSSMAQFLNNFSAQARSLTEDSVQRTREMLEWVSREVADLDGSRYFFRSGKFSVTTFEAFFAAVAAKHASDPTFDITADLLEAFRDDTELQEFTQERTNARVNVTGRLRRARELVDGSRTD